MDARAILPELIRRLISATVAVEHLDFPSGESVQQPGWDGLVMSSQGNHFVPLGTSGWECSCETKTSAKADSDYKKRTGEPSGLDASASFVFVTPRRWSATRAWAASKRALGNWADVRALNADDLEQWLELAPSVAAWFARIIGKLPSEAVALDDWWRDWSQSTRPQINPNLLTAGRAEAVEKLRNWLNGPAGVLTLEADTHPEAVAFLAAVVAQLPEREAVLWWSRGLCLFECVTARELQPGTGPLLLALPGLPDPTPQALRQHHVLLALSRGTAAGQVDIQLAFSRRAEFESALQAMGVAADEAPRLAHEVGCSISALRRRLAHTHTSIPAWARPEAARQMLPALLAGAWDEAYEGDRETLAELAGEPYEAFSGRLRAFMNSPDQPVRVSGSARRLTSDRDAFFLLARFLTGADLERFQTVALKVLAAPDPKRELEPQKRWMASVFGKEREHSQRLRQGLASSLALFSVFGEAAAISGPPQPGDRAAFIVSKLLNDAGAERWLDVADVLPNLAEAAPDAFLSSVEASLDGDSHPVVALFEETPNPFSASAGHTYLLWALEGLAWEPLLLGRVALVLTRLDRLDPGGKLANRPAASLRDVFLFWKPQTTATLAQRLTALDMLLAREPEAAWKLLLALAPRNHDFCSLSYKPRWRNCVAEHEVTMADWAAAIEWLATRLIDAAGRDGQRWAQAVEICPDFSPQQRQLIWKRMAESSAVLTSGGIELWSALRRIISQQRRFRDADWAIPASEVDVLVPTYTALAPTDSVVGASWLFDHNAAILNPPDDWKNHAAFEAAVDEERGDAIRTIIGENGIPGVVALMRSAPQPWMVGLACGKVLGEGLILAAIRLLLASPEPSLRSAGRALGASVYCERGWAWLDSLVSIATNEHWPEEKLVDLFLSLPFGTAAWERASALGQGVEARYWTETNALGWLNSAERGHAIRKLLDANRPLVAMTMASLADEPIDANLVIRILQDIPAALTSGVDSAGQIDAVYLERLFEQLDRAGMDTEVVARLEIPYLNLLPHWKRPAALHEALGRDPKFFAELIQLAFRESDGSEADQPEPTKDMVVRAHAAYTLLRSWRGLPGQGRDGELDGQQVKNWVRQARELCGQSGRGRNGDEQIGAVLARASPDLDGNWPAMPIREIIEDARSQDIERGIEVGVANRRGAHARSIEDGGGQERTIAARYRGWAEALALSWPRTAAVLGRIADHYGQVGEFHDRRSEQIGWER